MFLSDITASTYIDILAEYSIGTPYAIGRGRYIGAYFLSADHLSSDLTQNSPLPLLKDMDIQQVLLSAIQHGSLPPPTPDSCYFVFTPPGVLISYQSGTPAGYHDSTQMRGPNNIYYAAIPYKNADKPFDPKAQPTQPDFDSMTETVSHELVEAVTNPSQAYNGWHTDDKGNEQEIGDICQGEDHSFVFHEYRVSSFWSNKQNRCISNCQQVQIRPKRPHGCLAGLIENEIVEFLADTSCLSPVELTYEWTSQESGSTVPTLPHDNHKQHFSASIPAAPNDITVTVTVTDTEHHETSSHATFKAITPQEAEKQVPLCEAILRIQNFAEVNFLVDPLWDPLRDFTVYPIQVDDIYKMHQDAQQLVQLTGTLVRAYEATQEQGPVI